MYFSQSSLPFDLSLKLLILHPLIAVSTQFYDLSFLVILLVDFPWYYYYTLGLLLHYYPFFYFTRPIQLNRLILTNESISIPPNSCSNS